MKKYVKWLLGAVTVGSSIGLIIAHFCKNSKKRASEEASVMEEEDFDLDGDLKPSSERGYVSLNKVQENTEEETKGTSADEEEAPDTSGTSVADEGTEEA